MSGLQASGSEPVVILGSGLAGYTLAREFRKLDSATPLVIVSRDHGGFYSKPMLSNALAQGKSAEALLNADTTKMAAQLDARILPNTQAIGIKADACTLITDQCELHYRDLVLAVGADPFRLTFEGDGAEQVLSVNDLDDYAHFRSKLAGTQRVLIIGAGLIGCEFANDLFATGHQVMLVDLAEQALGRLGPAELARQLQARFAENAVEWHLGTSVQRIDKADSCLRVQLADGSMIEADIILSAIGLRPRLQLAQAAGLAVGRGIQVDRQLRSSDPHIFALGDCAEVDGLSLPFVMPIMQAARALAKTLAGEATDVRYPAMPVVVKTPAYPVVVAPPAAGSKGTWAVTTDAAGVQALFRNAAGDLLGFALSGAAVADKQALTKQLPPVLA